LGRRNYLFAGSDSGGDRAASIYTLVASALLNGLNPEAYLKDILTKIAEGHTINRIDELMPWRMASAGSASPTRFKCDLMANSVVAGPIQSSGFGSRRSWLKKALRRCPSAYVGSAVRRDRSSKLRRSAGGVRQGPAGQLRPPDPA
jgi:IS66 C-terminal element